MKDPSVCLDKLRELAKIGSGDPRKTAAKIVRDFAGDAKKKDLRQLHQRLEDTLLAGKWTIVPSAFLDEHSRWLAALESACAECNA